MRRWSPVYPRGVAILAALLGFLAAIMAIRAAALNMLLNEDTPPSWALRWTTPRFELRQAIVSLQQTRLRVTPQMTELAGRTLRAAPLADEPFVIAGLSAFGRGQTRWADRLFAEAARRDPRTPLPRLMLLNQEIKDGRVAEATRQVAIISQLLGEANALLVPAVAGLAASPGGRAPAAAALRDQPTLRDEVLSYLAANGGDPSLILALAGPAAYWHPGMQPSPWQGQLLGQLMQRGEFARARAVWARLGGRSSGGQQRVYDPRFTGLPGPPPFNWTFLDQGPGVAEAVSDHGLRVEYYGRDAAILAQQIILLPPGAYALTTTASSSGSMDAGGLAWVVSCYARGAQLASLPLTAPPGHRLSERVGFTVPPTACPAQILALTGTPLDVPVVQQMTVSAVSIGRAP